MRMFFLRYWEDIGSQELIILVKNVKTVSTILEVVPAMIVAPLVSIS